MNTAETSRTWTPERLETLKRMWADGASSQAIAEAIGGVSRSAVIGKAYRLKMPRHPESTEKRHARCIEKPKSRRGKQAGSTIRIRNARRENRAIVDPRLARRAREHPKPIPIPDGDAARIGLMDLTPQTCKWPVGDPGDPAFGFCGEPSVEGKPYCETHCARSYNRVCADDQ